MPSGFDEFREYIGDFAKGTFTQQAIEAGLNEAKVSAVAGVRRCFDEQCSPDGTPWPPLKFGRPNGGDQVLRDTGRLMASVNAVVEGDEISVQTNRIGSGVQNYGGVIVPVNVKFLTIPMTIEAKRAGGARNFPGELRPVMGKNRQSGVLLDSDGEVQYLMVKKVTIPQREFLGFSKETQAEIMEIVRDVYMEMSARRAA